MTGFGFAIATGSILDRMLGELPPAWHPVARFGSLMQTVEQRRYGPTRAAGVVHVGIGVGTRIDIGIIARAAIESLAEKTVDAMVAPLWWAAVPGAPGVLAHRAVDNLDDMIGHRTERYEQFGWASARLDDAMNDLPARTAALAVDWCHHTGLSRSGGPSDVTPPLTRRRTAHGSDGRG